ncbi:Fur family transcriptional regulator [Sphingomonas sp. BK069]|uniref:Fur family transcriptional regulator n=1 Tax=Sphingomonas sp. BK069 TaxID=2586979 RepID=UPI001617DC98|nr:Fur family transcriptional regulator [Sphingomonas sp. BK069]MBB3349735.1 Fur family ferric uptake transcriptional regulator [Sphingomonas sp. BK069]
MVRKRFIHADRGSEKDSRTDELRRELARRGCRATPERELIARIVREAADHPDVNEIHRRGQLVQRGLSVATVYRTVKLLVSLGIFNGHRFGNGRTRYEFAAAGHHDHLIDIETGQIVEFRDPQLAAMQTRLAREMGYEIVSYRLEVFAAKRKATNSKTERANFLVSTRVETEIKSKPMRHNSSSYHNNNGV